jgi:hypothetical protein
MSVLRAIQYGGQTTDKKIQAFVGQGADEVLNIGRSQLAEMYFAQVFVYLILQGALYCTL